MTLRKNVFVTVLLSVMALTAKAQAQSDPYARFPFPRYQSPPSYSFVPNRPLAWSYDPYTSGLGPCPQRLSGGDPPCKETMFPTFGQPSYWPQ
jgi:hypothetical protein